jgi:hypothetical protein
MKLSLDQTTDFSDRETYTLLQGVQLPEFVKSGELEDPDEYRMLSKEAFADQYNKAFPINSKPNIYISNAHFVNKRAELCKRWGKNYTDVVHERIIKAAEIFDIQEDLKNYDKLAEQKNAQDYKQEYLYSTTIEGAELDLFPVKTAADFSQAADYFSKHVERYPFNWRRPIAEVFVKRASDFSTEVLPDILCKYAGLCYPHKEKVKDELNRRMAKISSDINKKKYAELIESIDKLSSKEEYFKLAEDALVLETTEGLWDKPKQASVLGDIVDHIFTLSIDKVAELLDVVEMAGHRYQMQDLQKISADIYKEAFGVDLNPKEAAQLRDVLPTMPLSDVSLFRELSGVKPI